MFKLINKEDSKVFSSSMFIKNADFFKDEFAFFDAYSALCEKNIKSIPNYCVYQDGKFCLEGVCLFIKTYASEFSFKTIDLSIDYLKTLYYAIAALSNNSETVDRDVIVNEFLVYKDINEKQFKKIGTSISKVNKEFSNNKNLFEKSNDKYLKYSTFSKILKVLSMIIMIVAFIVAVIPTTLYYAGLYELKRTIIVVGAIFLVGLILKLVFSILQKYLAELSMDEAYKLQNFKKNKNESFKIYSDIKNVNGKIISEHYEYNNSFYDYSAKKLKFDDILKLANLNQMISYNIKSDVLKTDKKQQAEVYDIIDRIANVTTSDAGRLENIYKDIRKKDHLKYNNYVKFSFLNKFIENASETKVWRLDVDGKHIKPFDIDAKEIYSQKIAFSPNEGENIMVSEFDMFMQTKYAKKQKQLNVRNIKNEETYNMIKNEYISHFYDYEKIKEFEEDLSKVKENKNKFKSLPLVVSLKLAIIKNRIICNTLGEQDFVKIKDKIVAYEKKLNDNDDLLTKKTFINEKTTENKNFIRSLFDCDDIIEIGNDEVLCVVGDYSFTGFRLDNI